MRESKVSTISSVPTIISSQSMLEPNSNFDRTRGHLLHLAAVRPVMESLQEKMARLPSKLEAAKSVARASKVSLEADLVDTRHDVSVEDGDLRKKTKAILDTGALEYNYISYRLAYDLNLECMQLDKNIIVSSIDGETVIKRFVIIPKVTLVYDRKKYTMHNQMFLVLQHCPVSLIIGLPTIREQDLTSVFKEYFKVRHKRILRAKQSDATFREKLIRKYQEIKKKSGRDRGTAGTAPLAPHTAAPGRQDPSAAGLFVTTDMYSTGVAAQTKEGDPVTSMPNPREVAHNGT